MADHQPHIKKGPVEGIIIVDGRPRMERVDMPTISFSAEALKRLKELKTRGRFFCLGKTQER